MTDQDALLATILANPLDDLPRLVYADFVEENGEAERGELIRLQCELAPKLRWYERNPKYAHESVELDPLQRREHELLTAHGPAWSAPVARILLGPDARPLAHFGYAGGGARRGHCSTPVQWEWRRGFIESVTVPLAKFMEATECGACIGMADGCDICNGTGQVDHPNGGVNYCPNAYDDDGLYDPRCVPVCERCGGSRRSDSVARRLALAAPVLKVTISDAIMNPVRFSGSRDGHIACRAQDAKGWIAQFDATAFRAVEAFTGDGFIRTMELIHRTEVAAVQALSRAAVAHMRSAAGQPALQPVEAS